jgi:hypothetical protein
VMTITSIVRAAYHRGAKLIEVNDTMVAKLYDPLYYPRFNECGGMKDSVQNAESDYSCEAVAYQVLQNSPAAQAVTPKYFGTWIAEIETPVGKFGAQTKHTRQVQLILVECLRGQCMS